MRRPDPASVEADDRFTWWDELVYMPGVRRGREEGVMAVDVREKLWRFVKEAIHSWESDVNMSDHITDNLIARGVTVQEWNPISEPPKEKGTYLVCTDNGGVLLGHWYGTAWNAGGGAKKHLAYWMEKPQPPKGE